MGLDLGPLGANIGYQFRSQSERDAAGAGDDVTFRAVRRDERGAAVLPAADDAGVGADVMCRVHAYLSGVYAKSGSGLRRKSYPPVARTTVSSLTELR